MSVYLNGEPFFLPIAYSGGFDNYSEEEVMIGRWIDGKPLYRQMNELTIPNGSEDVLTVTKTFPDTYLIHYFNGIIISDSNIIHAVPFISSSNAYARMSVTNGSRLDFTTNNKSFVGRTVRFYIEYTKTTDNPLPLMPNSGFGEIYDDQERLIGSWFGKPMFQKVFIGKTGNTVNTANFVKDVSELNIDAVIQIFGAFYAGVGASQLPVPYYNSVNEALNVYYQTSSKNIVERHVGDNINGGNLRIIIKYTKSTD